MRLDLGAKGDWIVDPSELATRFQVSAAFLERLKRQGLLQAFIKPGEATGSDETCVTVNVMNQVWRGYFDKTGTLVREELF